MLPRYVDKVTARGRTYLYFRRHGRRVKLPSNPDSAEFHKAYGALREADEIVRPGFASGSLGALIFDFQASPEFRALAQETRTGYARAFGRLEAIARFPASSVKRQHIMRLRDKLSDTPRAAHLLVQAASRLYEFGIDRGLVDANPARKIKRLARSRMHRAWDAADWSWLLASSPPWWLLTACMLGGTLAIRREDVTSLDWSGYVAGIVHYRAGKNGEEMWLVAPPALARHLEETLTRQGGVATGPIVRDDSGRRITPSRLSHTLRAHCLAHGRDAELHFHGLRHMAAGALAEAKCTEAEIAAVTGHRSPTMVAHYTRQANRRRLASQALNKRERGRG